MLAVWRAMFLREAVARISAVRMGWLWILVQPILHVAVLLALFTVVRMRVVPGVETAIWLMVGLIGFELAQHSALRGMDAISQNVQLFVYRQVKPVDAVLVRVALEGYLLLLVFAILLCGAALFGFSVVPAEPLTMLAAFLGLWLNGVGLALILAVVAELVLEARRVVPTMFRALYLLSGVIIPISVVPQPYREWVMLNPLAHGVELSRQAYFPLYHAAPEANLLYLYGWALVGIFLGLVLQVRFASKVIAK
jgi:capsular polysaccharide transport system permease protein